MPRQSEEERAAFDSALKTVAEETAIPQAELDALSVLEGGDFESFRRVWDG